MTTTTGTSGRDATLSANLGEHHRHVPRAVAMQIAPIVVPRINLRVNHVIDAVDARSITTSGTDTAHHSHQQKCRLTTIEKYIRKSSRFPSTATITKRLRASSLPGEDGSSCE